MPFPLAPAIIRHSVLSRVDGCAMTASESPLADFPALITLPILWGDMDALNHVNNTVHLRWMESSRIRYIEQAGMRELLDAHQLGPILASVNCNYKRQLRYPGHVIVGTRVAQVGRSSLSLAHCVVNQESGELAATGESVVVVFDFEKQRPRRIPEDVRDAIVDFQGAVSDAGPVERL